MQVFYPTLHAWWTMKRSFTGIRSCTYRKETLFYQWMQKQRRKRWSQRGRERKNY